MNLNVYFYHSNLKVGPVGPPPVALGLNFVINFFGWGVGGRLFYPALVTDNFITADCSHCKTDVKHDWDLLKF